MSVIDDRCDALRRILEACEAVGLDPAVTCVDIGPHGAQVHPDLWTTEVQARAIIAAVTDQPVTASDEPGTAHYGPYTVYSTDYPWHRVYGAARPEAVAAAAKDAMAGAL